MFSQAFISYRIETPALGLVVQRRYNDFVWLRETLGKAYPLHIIPPLPPKTPLKSFEQNYIKTRMRKL
jgi:hypothetical protein